MAAFMRNWWASTFDFGGSFEGDEEWRDVQLSFSADPRPREGQVGSTDNAIMTSKYTYWNLIPKGTFEQFRRLANVYFLLISVLMIIGTYVPNTWENSIQYITTLGPLCVIVGCTLVKEGLEDSKRHSSDAEVNSRKVEVLEKGPAGSEPTFVRMEWRFVQPGMVLRIHDREEIPADVIPLASSGEEGKCYIETANIDGETNLKLRGCAPVAEGGLPGWENESSLSKAQGLRMNFEPPNPSIHTFQGTIQTSTGAFPVGPSEILLRGAVLRNTKWVLAAVVYTGRDTKIVMNSREVPSKLSTIEQTVNHMIYFILFADIVLTTAVTICHAVFNDAYDRYQWYICINYRNSGDVLFEENCRQTDTYTQASYWPTFFILFNNFLPLSLYVTLEIVNFLQAFYVDQDIEMYDETQDTPALARTSNQNGDLGQIEYVFSDKTGTLTCNEMKFRRCSVGGEMYGNLDASNASGQASLDGEDELVGEDSHDHDKGSGMAEEDSSSHSSVMGLPIEDLRNRAAHGERAAMLFAQLLAICHTVVVETDHTKGTTSYQAESPDEEALVDGGIQLGFTYLGSSSDTVRLEHMGSPVDFKLLALIPFDSTRKRMSVLVVSPEGEYIFFCKGADNVIFDRASTDYSLIGDRRILESHLETFATEGLRTLVLAMRTLSKSEAEGWLATWNAASTSKMRDEEMPKAAALIEKDLVLIGATAIEDRLQDGVPDTIAHLKKAGIKLWVLTGDKMATAINIGFSCKLLTNDMDMITLDKEKPGDGRAPVTDRLMNLFKSHQALSTTPGLRQRWRQMTGSCFGSKANGDAGPQLAEMSTDHLALVVDGPSLTDILKSQEHTDALLQLGCFCRAVIACRVSPAQKQLVVKMVKNGLPHKPITLSIGDGANDVPMIQEAQIGVGISGKEGRQAVNASDFAIAQFRFLERLLLIHGRWNYRRTSKVIIYSFYKNIVLVVVLFLYACYSSFSGQSLYGADSWTYSGYNFFLGMPPFMMGFFDKDLEPSTVQRFQKLYYVGLKKQDLNVANMVEGGIQATFDAFILFFMTKLAFGQSVWEANGETNGLALFGNAVFCNMVFAMLYKIMLLFHEWNWWVFFGFVFSYCLYLGFIFFYTAIGPRDFFGGEYEFYDIPQHMFGSPGFLMSLILVPMITFVADFIIKAIRLEFFTTRAMAAMEWESMRVGGLGPAMLSPATGSEAHPAELLDEPLIVNRDSLRALHSTMDLTKSPGGMATLHHRSSFAYDHFSTEFGGAADVTDDRRGAEPTLGIDRQSD